MKLLIAVTSAIVVLTLLSAGCTTAAKEGVGIIRGAKGSFVPLQTAEGLGTSLNLGEYQRFELGEISDGMGGRVPAPLFRHLSTEFQKQLEAKNLPNRAGGKALLIRGEILHYEDDNLVGAIVGPVEEVIFRAEMVDASSGRVLAVANCVGRTTTRVNLGVQKKAEGLAKAIVSWIWAYYPHPES